MQGLQELGWTDGRNVRIDTRWGAGDADRIRKYAAELFALYYNFMRIHKTLRTTPAMAAKVTKRLWEIGDIVDVLEAWENTT